MSQRDRGYVCWRHTISWCAHWVETLSPSIDILPCNYCTKWITITFALNQWTVKYPCYLVHSAEPQSLFWLFHSIESTVKRWLSTKDVACHAPRILKAYSIQNLLLCLIQLFVWLGMFQNVAIRKKLARSLGWTHWVREIYGVSSNLLFELETRAN